MELSLYRKNVLKTLSVKPAKLGLRSVASNTHATNIMHCSIGFHTEISELVVGASAYILGSSRLTDAIKLNLFEELGDALYYTTVLAKELKIKLPASTKKVKLKDMTRGGALLTLLSLATDIGDLAKKNFYGPKMMAGAEPKFTFTDVKDADGNVIEVLKTPHEYYVVDKAATEALYSERYAKISAALEQAVPLMWALSFDMFGVSPSAVMAGNIAKLSKRYGEGYFTLESAEDRDTEDELDAMSAATAEDPEAESEAAAI